MYSVHGAVLLNGVWYMQSFASDGDASGSSVDDRVLLFTIVEEWDERPEFDWSKAAEWQNYVAKDKDGVWHIFDAQPTILGEIWYLHPKDGGTAMLNPNYYPEWTGDWQDSLIKRPKR